MPFSAGLIQTLFRRVGDHLREFHLRDTGQDLIEYALVAALLALMCSAALTPVAAALNNGVSHVGKKFKDHVDHGLHKGWYK